MSFILITILCAFAGIIVSIYVLKAYIHKYKTKQQINKLKNNINLKIIDNCNTSVDDEINIAIKNKLKHRC